MTLILLVLLPAVLVPSAGARAEVLREAFASPPLGSGPWQVHGDPSHFHWDSAQGDLQVIWDSSRPNAFFTLPLPTILTRAESFRFRFKLALEELRTDPSESTFQLAIGLIKRSDAFSGSFFRGAGIHPSWGPRNLVEFNFFPSSTAISATCSAVAVATNNLRWAMVNLFPFDLEPGPSYDIEVAHDAHQALLSLKVLRDGLPFAEGSARLDDRFGDFRLDAFSVTSYSGDHQPAGYGGQLRAQGRIDDVELEFPPPPSARLTLHTPDRQATVTLPAIPGWTAVLERSDGNGTWDALPAIRETIGDLWQLTDAQPPQAGALYRVRLDRP